MTLRTWIEKTGPKKVATLLKVDSSTVYQWARGNVAPRPKQMVAIYKKTKGKVSYKTMVEAAATRKK